MRIPRDKLYRAFPELDRFSDEQCERFVQRVRITATYRLGSWAAIGFTVVVATGLIASGLAVLDEHLHRSLWLKLSRRTADTLLLVYWLVPIVSIPPFVGLLTRDIVLRIYLRWAVQMQIERVRCRSCKYLLIGQVANAGLVTCPECGARNSLQSLGLTEQDLVPPERGEDRLADFPAS